MYGSLFIFIQIFKKTRRHRAPKSAGAHRMFRLNVLVERVAVGAFRPVMIDREICIIAPSIAFV